LIPSGDELDEIVGGPGAGQVELQLWPARADLLSTFHELDPPRPLDQEGRAQEPVLPARKGHGGAREPAQLAVEPRRIPRTTTLPGAAQMQTELPVPLQQGQPLDQRYVLIVEEPDQRPPPREDHPRRRR